MSTCHSYVRGGVLAVALTAASASLAEPYVVPDAWTDTPAAEVVPGGMLNSAVDGPPRTYNPLQSLEVNLVVGMNTDPGFGAAVLGWSRPDDGSLEPRAAQSWLVSDDGLTVTVVLRPELSWSDGTPITAQDYLLSYELQINPDTSARGPEDWTVDGELIQMEATGTHSLRITFPGPDRLAMQMVAGHYPLPDHIFGETFRAGGAGAVTALWGTGTPPSALVFSGSMRVKEVRDGERMVLERNPYFGQWTVDATGRPLPYLDGVTFTEMQPESELNAFLAGDIDSFWVGGLGELAVVFAAIANDGLDAVAFESVFPEEGVEFIAFNWNLASDPYKQELLRSRDFRRAVAHLVDRAAMIDLVHSGAAFPLSGGVHPGYQPWFDEDLVVPDFDVEAAIDLLAGIGFTTRDASGYLIDAQGRRAGFTIMTVAGWTEGEQVVTIFADTAREAGVDVRMESLAFPLLVDLLVSSGDDRGWEAVYIGLTPSDRAWPLNDARYSCTGAVHLFNQSGDCLFPTEHLIAELSRRGRATLDDDEALRVGREIQRLEVEQAAMIYTVAPAVHLVRSGRVRGDFPPELWNARNGFGWIFTNSVR